jgi:hypothetical protein
MGTSRGASCTDDEIEKIAHRIIMELETASSKNLSDVHYAKTILQLSDLHYTNEILQEIANVSTGSESVIEKKSGDKGIGKSFDL